MIYELNQTHDPGLRSWVEAANDADTDFPIQNLPLGVFRRLGSDQAPRLGCAIGDRILDLAECAHEELVPPTLGLACEAATLNSLMALGAEHWSALRTRLVDLLRMDNASVRDNAKLHELLFVPMSGAELLLPAMIRDYSDFYASIFHATNVGSMFRPDHPLLPNYKYVPIGYHGRASSIVVSGAPVRRPCGQTQQADAPPTFGPCQQLDYELEVGAFVGPGNELGEPIAIDNAERHLFGLCLVNDWSARDIQRWEYQPLGPFLAKSFATTISPWVVTMEALAPFRAAAFARPADDPSPLPYLHSADDQRYGGVDLVLEVSLRSQQMREQRIAAHPVSRGNLRNLYWTLAQLLTHHASNGCNLRAGDLLASGTVSGETKDSRGCLLELTWRGTEPLTLPTGETRRFLEDGDEVIMRGFCEGEGFARIGLGECRGLVTAAGA